MVNFRKKGSRGETMKAEMQEVLEEQLVKLAQDGDSLALENLIKIYQGLMYYICDKYFLRDGEKEDLMQEAAIGLIEAVKAYNPESGKKFKNFAILCITREINSCIKRSNRKKHQILNEAIPIYAYAENEDERLGIGVQNWIDRSFKDESLTPEALLVEQETLNEIMYTVNSSLSDMEKQVLRLRINGHSYNEITLKLNLQTKSVDNAVQRIRKKIATRTA
ncbi:MAG: sigma-70 family RNA polymerase sigma factor [Peptococcaceae bacterium]